MKALQYNSYLPLYVHDLGAHIAYKLQWFCNDRAQCRPISMDEMMQALLQGCHHV